MRRSRVVAAIGALALLGVASVALSYSSYAKWASSPVTFYVNPTNNDVSASAASTAVQYAMNVWNTQSQSSFRFQYGGTANDTTSRNDNRNVLIFRNATNGSSIGTTYSWWDSNNRLLDSDIIIWDAGFNFFTGSSGCGLVSNAAYLEDIATHELGHSLGLNHSSYSDATMYPSYGYCSMAVRTLASDDIAGARALYPANTSNTLPVVTITSPANGATFTIGTNISLAATATDAQDGNISSRITWTDNGAPIGSGNLLSSLLSLVGIHTYVASVTDNNNAQASSQVSITVTLLPGGGTSATLTTTKAVNTQGVQRTYLYWTGLTGLTVDVYRNNVKVVTTVNDGSTYDTLPTKTPGSYNYFVCSTGTTTCTNTVTVVFP
jgi:hypothetical protein